MHIKEIKQRIIDRGLVQSKYSKHVKRRHREVPEVPECSLSAFLLSLPQCQVEPGGGHVPGGKDLVSVR